MLPGLFPGRGAPCRLRVASQTPAAVSLEPWEGRWITLAAPRAGATYLLTLTEGGIGAAEAD